MPENSNIPLVKNPLEKELREKKNLPQKESVWKRSLMKALGGGVAGSVAMLVQVTSLMWLRTTMNYQYRYGMKTREAMKKLYTEGGIRRFYRGYAAAIAIGPLSRFGDTASNSYVLELLKETKLSTSIKTVCGSAAAASFRILLMPLDAFKTTLQVEGANGIKILANKLKANGIKTLYNGTVANMSATFVGHYPWFLTYNVLNAKIPRYAGYKKLLRNALIGFNCALISDTCSNSLRVIKTTKQTYSKHIGYVEVVKIVIEKDGILGLFGRGLKTRILTNGLQGIMFTVIWNIVQDWWFKNSK